MLFQTLWEGCAPAFRPMGTRQQAAGSWTLTYSRLRGPEAQGGCGCVESWGSEGPCSQRSPQLRLRVSKQGRLSCPQSCDTRGGCQLLQDSDKVTGTANYQFLTGLHETLSMPMDAAGSRGSEHRAPHQCCPVSVRPLGTVLRSSPWSCPEPSLLEAETCPTQPFPTQLQATLRLDQHCSLRAGAAQE